MAAGPEDPRNPYPPRRQPLEDDPTPHWFRVARNMLVSIACAVFGFYFLYLEVTRYGGRPFVIFAAIALILGPTALPAFLSQFFGKK